MGEEREDKRTGEEKIAGYAKEQKKLIKLIIRNYRKMEKLYEEIDKQIWKGYDPEGASEICCGITIKIPGIIGNRRRTLEEAYKELYGEEYKDEE